MKDAIHLTPSQDETIRWFKKYGGCHIKALKLRRITPLIKKGILSKNSMGVVQLTKLGLTAEYKIKGD